MIRSQSLGPERSELFKTYGKLREFVQKSMGHTRDELVPLLYYFYLHMFYIFISEELPRDLVRSAKVDFLTVNSYNKEISYLDSIIQAPTEEKAKEDRVLQQIFNTYKTIMVSQYTLEAFETFLRKNKNVDEMFQQVQGKMKIDLRTTKDPESEANKMSNGIVSVLPYDEIKKVNDIKIKLAPLKDDVSLIYKLDTLYDAKKKNELSLNSKKMKDKLLGEPDIYESSYLEKSEIPLPETKFRHKVDFAKAFLDKPSLEDNDANILNISVSDPWEKITCVEISRKGNILLLGFEDFQIILISLNQHFSDLNALEKHKKKHLENLSKGFSFTLDEDHTDSKGREKQTTNSNKDEDKHQIIEFVGHEDTVTSLSLNYDELYFVSASVDSSVRLWCIRERTCLGVFKGHINTIWSVKFSPKGFYFASGSSDTTVRLWNTDKPFAVRIFLGHSSDVHIVDFSENCNYIITASYDRTVRIWEIYSARCCKIFFHNNEIVSALSMSYNGNYLVSGSEDGLIILWDMSQEIKINSFYLEQGKRVNSVSFSLDGSYLVISSKHRISYYEIEKLKNEQGDMYESVLRGETKTEVMKKSHKNIVANSFSMSSIPDYDFLQVKFSYGNFIYLISRSFHE